MITAKFYNRPSFFYLVKCCPIEALNKPLIRSHCTSNKAFSTAISIVIDNAAIADCVVLNLNTSDSAIHHTISLMYVGAHHLEFGITSHKVS